VPPPPLSLESLRCRFAVSDGLRGDPCIRVSVSTLYKSHAQCFTSYFYAADGVPCACIAIHTIVSVGAASISLLCTASASTAIACPSLHRRVLCCCRWCRAELLLLFGRGAGFASSGVVAMYSSAPALAQPTGLSPTLLVKTPMPSIAVAAKSFCPDAPPPALARAAPSRQRTDVPSRAFRSAESFSAC
jgi:hypothetical protein